MNVNQGTRAAFASPRASAAWALAGLLLFGVGFGFVEAAVVVDLRAVLAPALGTDGLSEILPMVPMDRLERAAPSAARLLNIERWRELATLMMLAGAGMAAGRTFAQRFAAFVISFGAWDLTYYLFLKVLLGWPASVWTWDVLFLVPVPWAAPVLAPMIVAASMIMTGAIVIVHGSSGRRFHIAARDWMAIVLGGLVLIASFCWSWRDIAAGRTPEHFYWPLFAIGEVLGLLGFLRAWRASRGGVGISPCKSHRSSDEKFPICP